MEAYLGAHGYDVWNSIIVGSASTDVSRSYNSKAMNVILSDFSYFLKAQVGQCSLARRIWKKLKSLYLKKNTSQYEDDNDCNSNRENT